MDFPNPNFKNMYCSQCMKIKSKEKGRESDSLGLVLILRILFLFVLSCSFCFFLLLFLCIFLFISEMFQLQVYRRQKWNILQKLWGQLLPHKCLQALNASIKWRSTVYQPGSGEWPMCSSYLGTTHQFGPKAKAMKAVSLACGYGGGDGASYCLFVCRVLLVL